MATSKREHTDPASYAEHIGRFSREALPTSQAGWLERAREVARILAEDAAARDIANLSPQAEVSLLKSSGLLKLLVPRDLGGGGEDWSTAYKAIREVAKGDGSIGMLLGYHTLWSTVANVVGSDEQVRRLQEQIAKNNYFVGGAVNPRDNDLKITVDGDEIVFNGFKNFNTGGVVSDLTVLEGVLDGTTDHIFAIVETQQPGIVFSHNWDSVGLRLTESGSVKIENIRAPWSAALGWDTKSKQPDPAILGIPFGSLLLPTIQLVFSNFYLGIAQGALDAASKYTVNGTRAWPFGGDNKDKAVDEWYILERYGTYSAHLQAADALADRAGAAATELYRNSGQHGSTILNPATSTTNGHHDTANSSADLGTRKYVTPQIRGEFATLVASVKVVTTDTSLLVTSGIFEMLGARATGKKYGFDRFWRDVRTHTLHDPVAYKKREVGRYQVLREIPEPTWYT